MGDLLEELGTARYQADLAETEVTRLVRRAREAGYSWDSIGRALGVTRQSAWERYGREVEE